MKYNITEKKEKPAKYRTNIRAEVLDTIYEAILRKMIVEKKYREADYTAQKLAQEIGTNPRYISAAVSMRFQMSFPELINNYRVRDACILLTDKRNLDKNITEIAMAVGFRNRQSLYVAFYREKKMTPTEFRERFFEQTR